MSANGDAMALLETAEELAQLGGWELDVETLQVRWTAGMYRVHGLAPASGPPSLETLHGRVHPDDRDRIQALVRHLAEHPELVAAEGIVDAYRTLWDDGSVHHLRFVARVEDHRLVGIAQDVTAERLTEQELRAHYAVSQALREWESFDEGVAALLRRLATAMEYPLAALWLWDEEGQVRCAVARSGTRPTSTPGTSRPPSAPPTCRPASASRGWPGATASRSSRPTSPPTRGSACASRR